MVVVWVWVGSWLQLGKGGCGYSCRSWSMDDRERFFFLLYDLFSRCLDCLDVCLGPLRALQAVTGNYSGSTARQS